MRACILNGVGDHTHLQVVQMKEPVDIGPEDVLIQQTALGINFDDVMYRRGEYPIPESYGKTPIIGFEAAGTVLRKGEKVKGFNVGDQVAYGFCPLGAYAEQRVIDYRFLLSVPQEFTPETVAGVLRKGLTAEYLLFHTFAPRKGNWILIHSVAGGVGHIMAKWAKFAGLNVIGTVCDDSKLSIALATGCDFVINRATEDIVAKVAEYTNEVGVHAVFDGIGKPVFEKSLKSLKPGGLYVSYGYAGGKLDPIDVMELRKRCLFFTAPVLELYKRNRFELIYSASAVFDMLRKGVIAPNISRYGMDGIQQAHADLESGKTTGSIVINC